MTRFVVILYLKRAAPNGLGLEVQPGVITITSCQPKQKSWEVDELEQGVFTYALLEALQLPGEQSCATVDRLGSYLQRRVPELCQRYGKAPRQVPRVCADPIEKQHFILIPQYARQADLDLLKLDAYRLCKTNPALAERICLRLNALAMGRDLEVIDLLTDLRRQTRNVPPAPSEPTPQPLDETSARSATAATTTVRNVADNNFSPPQTRATKVIGIDFGTTKSVVSVWLNKKNVIIPNSHGFSSTPSIVACKGNSDFVVGEATKHQTTISHGNVFYEITNLIGRCFDEIKYLAAEASFEVVDIGGEVKINCPADGEQYTPEQLAAKIFHELKNDASQYLGESVTQAVIAVPAYFNYIQRQAIRVAARIAGLEVLRMHTASTAAAISYGLHKARSETILVFDLGASTLNISILEIGDGIFEVLATSGDTHLGGNDFDRSIATYLANEFQRTEDIDLRQNKVAWQRLIEAAERAKIDLSTATQAEINLPFISTDQDEPKHIDFSLTRSQLEELCFDLIDRCQVPVEQALKDARLSKSDINEIILVGGSTRIPAIKDLVKRNFGKLPNQTVNPDEVVSLGMAVLGGVLAGEVKDILLLDVIPLSLGIETSEGVMTKMISRNTTFPTNKSEVFSTAQDGQTSVEIHVFQGDCEMAADNKRLATLNLSEIPPAPRGVPQIEVTFFVDANESLEITAKDKGTGKEKTIVLYDAFTLDKSERIPNEYKHGAPSSLALRIEKPGFWPWVKS